jgi:hypothetical protein
VLSDGKNLTILSLNLIDVLELDVERSVIFLLNLKYTSCNISSCSDPKEQIKYVISL